MIARLNPYEYQHWLKAYDGEEVINYRYWFNWYIKDKATQTSKFTFMNRKDYEYPVFTPPPSPKQNTDNRPLYVDIATDATDTAFAPVNVGLVAWKLYE